MTKLALILPNELLRIIGSYASATHPDAVQFQTLYRDAILSTPVLKTKFSRVVKELNSSALVFECEECGDDILSTILIVNPQRGKRRMICETLKKYRKEYFTYLFVCEECV